MPRRPMLLPHLSEEALRLNYRQCKDSADRTRWQALWLLAQGPGAKTQREVGQLLDRSHTWVGRLVGRYNAYGPQAVPTQKRAGASQGGTPAALDARGMAALDHALEHESPPGGGLCLGPTSAPNGLGRLSGLSASSRLSVISNRKLLTDKLTLRDS